LSNSRSLSKVVRPSGFKARTSTGLPAKEENSSCVKLSKFSQTNVL
jgi:hypothetical protein